MQFYSYLWLREDGTPYYAGKGHGNRAFTSRAHNLHCPKDRARIMVFPQLNEVDAFESEKEMIWLFGRKDLGTGCLRNLTDGGEGTAGAIVSKETRKKQSAAKIGKPSPRKGQTTSLETRVKQSAAAKNRPCLLAGWNKGISSTEEHKKKQSESLKQNYKPRLFSEETRKKMSLAKIGNRCHLGFTVSAESRQKMKVAALARVARERELL